MARILILTQPYVPDPSTTGQHLHSAAMALTGRGHEVHVLAANRGYEDPNQRYPSRETRDGVHIRRVPFSSFGKGTIATRATGALFFAVQASVRGLLTRTPDLILVSTSPPFCSIAALIVSWLRDIPICYWIHDLNPDLAIRMHMLSGDAFLVRLMNWLNYWSLARARRIIVLDRFMAERVQRKLDVAAKTTILPPWPHNDAAEWVEHADNPWRRKYAGAGRRVVMYSGNHTPANPLNTMLQAALRLRDEESLEFLFVGGGLAKQEIEASIERERPRNIRSLPYQPLETLGYSLSAADVHVVSAGHQVVGISHPCKLYGALAAGRPILLFSPELFYATDIIREQGIGWWVGHGDVDGAVEALRDIRNASRERLEKMGRTAQELARCRYSRDLLREQFCDEVEATLGEPPSTVPAPAETRLPAVSVVIPARNAEATIAATLDSVLSQEYEGSVEVIVADGSDTPATSELVRREYAEVKLISNPQRTTGFGMNAGLRAATGEIIVRCDAHATLKPGYLRRAVETLARTRAANVGGRQEPVGDGLLGRAVATAMTIPLGAGGGDVRYRVGGPEGPVDTVYLGSFRREALDAVGGYDPTLVRNGDYELNWRLRQRGEAVWFDPELTASYQPRSTCRELVRQYFAYGRWKRVVLRLHPASLQLRHLAAPAIVLTLAAVPALALAGVPWLGLALVLAYALAITAAGIVPGLRRQRAAAFLVPFVLVIMHLSWGIGFFFPPRR